LAAQHAGEAIQLPFFLFVLQKEWFPLYLCDDNVLLYIDVKRHYYLIREDCLSVFFIEMLNIEAEVE